MPFPLVFEGLEIPGLRALGFVIASDLVRYGTVREGVGPASWLPDLVPHLDAAEQRRLLHVLIAYKRPDVVRLGIRLAHQLGTGGDLLIAALDAHDLALLLTPTADGRTVEAELAEAAAVIAPLAGRAARTRVLESLRSAGLDRTEAQVLAKWADQEELLKWGRDLLAGGDPEVAEILQGALARPDVALAVLKLFPDL